MSYDIINHISSVVLCYSLGVPRFHLTTFSRIQTIITFSRDCNERDRSKSRGLELIFKSQKNKHIFCTLSLFNPQNESFTMSSYKYKKPVVPLEPENLKRYKFNHPELKKGGIFLEQKNIKFVIK